jgi:hypothetical protein
VDVVAGGGGEEDGGSGEVFGVAPATGGNAIEDLTGALGIVLQGLGVVGGEVAGGDGVDVDAAGGPLVGEGLGELADAAFGRGIGRDVDASLEGEQRGDVDDFAAALGEHVAAGVLGEAEDTGEVDIDDSLPVFGGVVGGGGAADDAGVVDEDVNGAEAGDGFVDEAMADILVADVADEGDGMSAGGVDECLGFFWDGAGAVESDVGASFGESEGDAGAEAARGTSDESVFTFEGELIEDQGGRLLFCAGVGGFS